MKQPTTQGLEWLQHSVATFNGSGYADMESVDDYIESYVAYKALHNKNEAVLLIHKYVNEIKPTVEHILKVSLGAGRKPAPKNIDRVNAYRKLIRDQVGLLS